MLRFLLFDALLAVLVTINNLYAQTHLGFKRSLAGVDNLIGIDVQHSGGSGRLFRGAFSSSARVQRLVRVTLAMGALLAAIGIWSYFGASVAYLRAFAGDGLADTFYETELHHMVPESLRATVLSLPSMGVSLGMMVLFPLAGWAMQRHHLGLDAGGFVLLDFVTRHANIASPMSRRFGIDLFSRQINIAIMKPPDEEAMAMARMMSRVDSKTKEPITGRCKMAECLRLPVTGT